MANILIENVPVDERAPLIRREKQGSLKLKTFFIFSHKIILFFILPPFVVQPFSKVCFYIAVCIWLVLAISLLPLFLYFPLVGYTVLASCTNSSTNGSNSTFNFEAPVHLSIVIPVFAVYSILGMLSYGVHFSYLLRLLDFDDEIFQPNFTQSNESIKSKIQSSHIHYTFFYIFAFFLLLISLILFVTISQVIVIYREEYIGCMNSFEYQVVNSLEYIAPIVFIGVILTYSSPLSISLSRYFILNIIHDKIFAVIDNSKEFILRKGISNVGNAFLESPLKLYYELSEFIILTESLCTPLKLLTFYSTFQVNVLFFSIIFHLKSLYFDRHYIVAGWLLSLFIYHFTTIILLISKISYLNKTLYKFVDTILNDKTIRESFLVETPENKEFSPLIKKELQMIPLSRVSVELFSLGDVFSHKTWYGLVIFIGIMIMTYIYS